MKRIAAAGCAALIALALASAGAQAATVRLGSPLTAKFTPGNFSAQQVTIVQLTLPEPGVNLINPVDGHVVDWQVGPSNGTFALQVVRFSQVTARSLVTSPLTRINTSGISAPVPVNLPIKRGDLIGIKVQGGSDLLAGAMNGSTFSAWSPALDDGQPFRGPDYGASGPTGVEFGVAATVRYCQVPKVLGKSPRVARERLTQADCTIGRVKKTKKTRKKKQVISQSVQPGSAISDTDPINLKVARKGG